MLIAERTLIARFVHFQKPTSLRIVCSALRCALPNMSKKLPKLCSKNVQILDLKIKLKTKRQKRLSFMQLQSCESEMNVMLLRRCLVNSPFKVFGSPLPTRKNVSRHSTFFRHVAKISSWKTRKSILVLLSSIKILVVVKICKVPRRSRRDNVISSACERDGESLTGTWRRKAD